MTSSIRLEKDLPGRPRPLERALVATVSDFLTGTTGDSRNGQRYDVASASNSRAVQMA